MPVARDAPLKMRRKGDALIITWPHSRRQVKASIYLAFSALVVILFLASIGQGGLSGQTLLISVLLKLLAVIPFTYAAIAIAVNRNQLKLTRNITEFSSGPMPLFLLRRKVAEIKGFFVPPEHQTLNGGKASPAIYYFPGSGKPRLLASNFDTREQAMSVLKELEDAYELPTLGEVKDFYEPPS